jgi:hypothetical protein
MIATCSILAMGEIDVDTLSHSIFVPYPLRVLYPRTRFGVFIVMSLVRAWEGGGAIGRPGLAERHGGRPPRGWGGRSVPGSGPRRAGGGPAASGVGAVLGLMREGAVTQLVQRPPGRLLEQVGGASIREAATAAGQV